jgi:hypothetical protein
MPPKVQVSSLRHFDDRRVLNTPLSLLACSMEGVIPESLVRSVSPAEAQQNSARVLPPLELQKQQLVQQHKEQERLKSLALVKKAYAELLKEEIKQTAGANSKDKASGNSPSRRGLELVPGAAFHKEIDDAIAADLSVAAYFFRQSKALEARAAAKKTLEENAAAHEARMASFAAAQQKELQLKVKRNEEHHQQVLQKQIQHSEELAAHKAERIQRLEQKIATVATNAEKITREKSTKRRQSKVDTAEIESIRQKKLDELEAKLLRHQELAKERLDRTAKEQELHDLKVSLKRQGFIEQKERVIRARECHKEHLQQQMDRERDAEEEERYELDLAAKKRAIIRQTLAHQRAEVDRYLSSHVGDVELAPPSWLEQRHAVYVREKEKSMSARKSSIRAKEIAPPAPAEKHHAFTPRRPSVDGGAQRPKGSAGERSDDSGAKAPRPPKDAFSISSPRISERQIFSRWMFE